LEFGKHKGNTLQGLMNIDKGYILLLAEVHMKASFHIKSQLVYEHIKNTYPNMIEEAKEFIKYKCKRCLFFSEQQPHCTACSYAIKQYW